jgi:ArsR family transcriptional regulator
MQTPVSTPSRPAITEAVLDEPASNRLAEVFTALSDPVRLRLFSLIAARTGGACACEMVGSINRSQPTVSHHLKALEAAGLLTRERRGRWIWYQVDRSGLRDAASLIDCC